MALAPLSQTILLTEDGSVIPVTEQVIIPPARLPLPVITTPADIASDGTPMVGKQLTGIDPVATFATYGNRRWLRGETVLARTIAYTSSVAGDIDWVVDVIGTDGVTVLTSGKRITVAAIPAPDPTIDNTFADNNAIMLGAVPGLLARMNSLVDRLTAVGIAAEDPEVFDLVSAALADLAASIASIDLHRPLSTVLTEMEAKMTAIERAANPPPQPGAYVAWRTSDTTIRTSQTNWRTNGMKLTGGGGTTGPALTLSGPSSVGEGNPSASAPALTLSGPSAITEGNPGASAPALTLSGPSSVAEGNPSVSSPALTLSGPSTVTEGN